MPNVGLPFACKEIIMIGLLMIPIVHLWLIEDLLTHLKEFYRHRNRVRAEFIDLCVYFLRYLEQLLII